MRKIPMTALVACGLSAAAPASAQPFTRNDGQAGAQAMFGVYLGQGDPNPYGFGFGLNGGYTFDFDIYLGGRFDYFFGGSHETIVGVDASANFLDLMLVGGYDIAAAGSLVVRPQLGIGMLWTRGDICSDGVCQDLEGSTEFILAPGVRALWEIGEPIHLSAEVSYYNVFAERNVDGIVFGLGAGATF